MSLPAHQGTLLSTTTNPLNYDAMMHRVNEDLVRWSGLQSTVSEAHLPTLHLDDLTGIPFTDNVVGVQQYQLRARVRAGTGDLFAATCPTMIDYEWYNRKILNLGAPTFIHAFNTDRPACVAAACQTGFTREHLKALATQRGGLTIHPYMGIQAVWELAEALSLGLDVPIRVLAPTPAATQLANNKVFFTEFVERHHDVTWVAPSRTADTVEDMVIALFDLAKTNKSVALKMPECASSTGIEVFASDDIRNHTPVQLNDRVRRFLTEKQWIPGEPVQVVAWLHATHSPSTQVWIPVDSTQAPIVQGIYEQLFTGPEKMFLGSVPSPLPDALQSEMSAMSIAVAKGLQELGYVGRCSFDFIICDDRPVFIECNGRWGGTSTPMNLVDRLFPDGRPPYVAKDIQDDRLKGFSFKQLAEGFGDALYRAETGKGHYILYNVGCLSDFGKFDVIVLGATQRAATDRALNELPAILNRM